MKNILKQHNIEIEANMQYDITELRINAVKRGLGIGYVMKEAVKNELENKELYEVKLPIELPISKINLIYIREQLTQSDKKLPKKLTKVYFFSIMNILEVRYLCTSIRSIQALS